MGDLKVKGETKMGSNINGQKNNFVLICFIWLEKTGISLSHKLDGINIFHVKN